MRQANKPQLPSGDNYFGKVSNGANINGHRPLRLMLRLSKPTNPPSWLSQADNRFFDWYPIGAEKFNNETTFDTILNDFIT